MLCVCACENVGCERVVQDNVVFQRVVGVSCVWEGPVWQSCAWLICLPNQPSTPPEPAQRRKCHACHAEVASMSPRVVWCMWVARDKVVCVWPNCVCVWPNVCVCGKVVCERVVCNKVACERAVCDRVVCDNVVWQSCVKELCVTKLCVCACVCVWQSCVWESCAWEKAAGGREWTGVTGVHHRRARTPHKDVWNKNPTQRCGEQWWGVKSPQKKPLYILWDVPRGHTRTHWVVSLWLGHALLSISLHLTIVGIKPGGITWLYGATLT